MELMLYGGMAMGSGFRLREEVGKQPIKERTVGVLGGPPTSQTPRAEIMAEIASQKLAYALVRHQKRCASTRLRRRCCCLSPHGARLHLA